MLKKCFITICLAIAVMLCFGGCASIASQATSSQAPSQDPTSAATSGEEATQAPTSATENQVPIVSQPITLTLATRDNYYAPASLTTNLLVWTEIAKKTGVTIQWDVQPSAQYTASMQTRLAAGANLPDILVLPGSNPTIYGQSGVVIQLNDLIAKYAPNIQRLFGEKPVVKKMLTSDDGNIYGIAPEVEGGSQGEPDYIAIRQDWLDKVQLPVPKTLDDWTKVLTAFAKDDPNGNGEADEIGFASDPVVAFCGAYGLTLLFSESCGQGFNADPNNKVFYAWTDPRMKDLLTYCNNLYTAGLISPDYGNPSAETVEAKAAKNLVGASQDWSENFMNWQNVLNTTGVNARYVMPIPPTGPSGAKGIVEAYGVLDGSFTAISKDCKNPDVAMKWLDYVYASPEGQVYMAWGVEGKTYTLGSDGKKQFTDFVMKNPDGLGPAQALRSQGAWPTLCWIQDVDTYRQMFANSPDMVSAIDTLMPYFVNPFPFLLGTKAEDDTITPIMSDIQTYKNEMISKFVMGQEPLSNFDQYVSKIQAMGIDTVTKIKQTQYDKMMQP